LLKCCLDFVACNQTFSFLRRAFALQGMANSTRFGGIDFPCSADNRSVRGRPMRRCHRKMLERPKRGKAALCAEHQGEGANVSRAPSAFTRDVQHARCRIPCILVKANRGQKLRDNRVRRITHLRGVFSDTLAALREREYWKRRSACHAVVGKKSQSVRRFEQPATERRCSIASNLSIVECIETLPSNPDAMVAAVVEPAQPAGHEARGGRKKRVALCLSGGMPDLISWQQVRSGLERHLLDVNSDGFEFDVFAHVYFFNPCHSDSFAELTAWKSICDARSESWSDSIADCITVDNPNIFAGVNTSRVPPMNVLSMWRKINLCHRLMEEHGREYDVVIRSRPDFLLQSDIYMQQLHLANLNLPWQCVGDRLSFDQFAIGPFQLMATYSALYNYAGTYYEKQHVSDPEIIYPERLLHEHLNVSSINPDIFDMRCTLLRANAKPIDPFGKLREHFPTAAFPPQLFSSL